MSMINDEVATIIENKNFVRCIVDDIILEKEFSVNGKIYYAYSEKGIMTPYRLYTDDFFSEMNLEGLLSENDVKELINAL